MSWCINLSRADTGSGALEWFDIPMVDLSVWAEVVNEMEKKRKKPKRR